ncbi:MAG TPA: hypothetical protein VHH36_08350 [Candidatus Thermoplasmatota archaeon]|nr:hypothetical protein [Candidatus Thermoplasmatota archaeon]
MAILGDEALAAFLYGLLYFALGALGALLVVYATNRKIPSFRAFEDLTDEETEVARRQIEREELDKLRKDVKGVDNATAERYAALSREHTARIDALEKILRRAEVGGRALGVAVYVLFGGVVAALVATYLPGLGDASDVPRVVSSFVTGTVWTTFLSSLGLSARLADTTEEFKALQKTAEAGIQAMAAMNKGEFDPKERPSVADSNARAVPSPAASFEAERLKTLAQLRAQTDRAVARLRGR